MKSKIVLYGIGGVGLTALFAYFNLSPPPPHEGAILSTRPTTATSAASRSLSIPAPVIALPQTSASQPLAVPVLSPKLVAEANTYYQRYINDPKPAQRFSLIRSVLKSLNYNPQNAHYLGLTPETLVSLVTQEARREAAELAPFVQRGTDNEVPNTEDAYGAIGRLIDAETMMSLEKNGGITPGRSWGQLFKSDGQPLSAQEVQNFQRDIGIELAKQRLALYQGLSSPEAVKSFGLSYLQDLQNYGDRAATGAGTRNVWTEIGISKQELKGLIDKLKNPSPSPQPTPGT